MFKTPPAQGSEALLQLWFFIQAGGLQGDANIFSSCPWDLPRHALRPKSKPRKILANRPHHILRRPDQREEFLLVPFHGVVELYELHL